MITGSACQSTQQQRILGHMPKRGTGRGLRWVFSVKFDVTKTYYRQVLQDGCPSRQVSIHPEGDVGSWVMSPHS